MTDKDTEEAMTPLPKRREPNPLVVKVIEKLGRTVNGYCICGGRGPEDNRACPACKIWHDMKDFLNVLL